jgi:hypothetical protein
VLAPLAVNVVVCPTHTVAEFTVTVGLGFTVTTAFAEVEQEPVDVVCVTTTLYVPEAIALIACVVAAVDHAYVLPADAVNVTLPPEQNVVGPEAVIVAF